MKKILKPIKQESGITLISLIITILILIVLAAALINISLDNVKIVDTAANSTELYAIEQYQGTIEEGMQKEILEEATLGETITQASIKEELNEIGDTVQTASMTESDTENVGDVIIITDEGYLYSAYYDENTGRQYVEYLGKGDSGSIPELYVSYSNGSITAKATANSGSISNIELTKSGTSLKSEDGSSLSYSVSTSGMYIVKATTSERNK